MTGDTQQDRFRELEALKKKLILQAETGQSQSFDDLSRLTQLEKQLGVGCRLDLEDIGE